MPYKRRQQERNRFAKIIKCDTRPALSGVPLTTTDHVWQKHTIRYVCFLYHSLPTKNSFGRLFFYNIVYNRGRIIIPTLQGHFKASRMLILTDL